MPTTTLSKGNRKLQVIVAAIASLLVSGGSYSWQYDKQLDFSLGGTLYLVGDAPIDQTSQGVRVKGDFENNAVLFLGGTLRYVF